MVVDKGDFGVYFGECGARPHSLKITEPKYFGKKTNGKLFGLVGLT